MTREVTPAFVVTLGVALAVGIAVIVSFARKRPASKRRPYPSDPRTTRRGHVAAKYKRMDEWLERIGYRKR